MLGERQVPTVLKEDAFGRVERIEVDVSQHPLTDASARAPLRAIYVRRVACGGRIPGSRWLARRLLARERRALTDAVGLPGIPKIVAVDTAMSDACDGADRTTKDACLLRSWIEGEPLHKASELPSDFFDQLDVLVCALHARGVCHNDLHKEQNIVVGVDGYPWLIDFQLASVHRKRSALFMSRAREDLRHVEKHRRRYSKPGRGRVETSPNQGMGHGLRRSWIAAAWRRTGKPLYVFVTRVLLGVRDGEERRVTNGPWPRWSTSTGPRPGLSRTDARSE